MPLFAELRSIPLMFNQPLCRKCCRTLLRVFTPKYLCFKAFRMKYLIFPVFVLMGACGPNNEEAMSEEGSTAGLDHAGQQLMDLSEHGYPFSLWVPSEESSGTVPMATFDDSFMHVKLQAGKRFQIIVRQEPPALERLKMALQNDPLRTHEYIREEPHLLIYKSTYPDEEISFMHFYYAFEVNGEPYIAEDVKEAELNEAAVNQMIEALHNIQLPI